MPKLKKKLFTKTLYIYARPENHAWVRKTAKKAGMSYSQFMDTVLTVAQAQWSKEVYPTSK